MFTSIVVGTDGSDSAGKAVARAAELARLCGATLNVVTAFRPVSQMVLNPEAMSIEIASMINPEADATTVCDRAAGAVEGLSVKTHVVAGNPADALIQVAEDQGADLIVVGSRGMTGARRMLGSVPNAVSHHAPCTVMIVSTS